MLPKVAFLNFIKKHALFSKQERILLAVSGGKDSVLMTHLFAQTGFSFGIAHCHFGLREADADADLAFVAQLAENYQVPFYSTRFDTIGYAKQQKISIQMAARNLRYDWFEEISKAQHYDLVALAHHQNDSVETILLNLTRGTGIEGLHGILPKRTLFVRPLLFLTRSEIDQIVLKENIDFREDLSNFSTKYARNLIRLTVIPKLKEINPALEETFRQNSLRFSALEELLKAQVDLLSKTHLQEFVGGEFSIAIAVLLQLHPQQLLSFSLFKRFGISESMLDDLLTVLCSKQPTGKYFETPSHRFSIDRLKVYITPLDRIQSTSKVCFNYASVVYWGKYHFKSETGEHLTWQENPNQAKVDAEKLVWPLQIRSWKKGDYFYPLGMHGKKKLSDFFTSNKIPSQLKKSIPVIINGNDEIIWIASLRLDDRYKISESTKKVVTLTCHYQS